MTSGNRTFVVISGLPGSGKSTIARSIGRELALSVIDKDDILETLFEKRGTGDAAWRRALSRESDELMKRQALESGGAVLTSFWHVPGMAEDSGTPIGWVQALPDRLLHVRCLCPPEVAARRFHERARHPGHLDRLKPQDTLVAEMRRLAALPGPEIGIPFDIDTSSIPDLANLIEKLRSHTL